MNEEIFEQERKSSEEIPAKKVKPDFVENIYEWIEVFVYSITFVMILFTFVMRLAVVEGSSMEKTLIENDTLVISDLFYTPKANDIIVFQSPTSNYKKPIVKRVIALEGQTVDIDFDNWVVKVDGVSIPEDDYVNKEYLSGILRTMNSSSVSFPHIVAEGCVFVLGDNRNASLDSRSSDIGDVDERFILGRVIIRILPLDKIGKMG